MPQDQDSPVSTQCKAKSPCGSIHRRPGRSKRGAQGPQGQLDLPPTNTETTYLDLPVVGSRQVLASFDGGDIKIAL